MANLNTGMTSDQIMQALTTALNGMNAEEIASAIDAAVSTKQNQLTETQLDAVNSGITAQKVAEFHVLALGTVVPDTKDPDTGTLYADLFELPIGKYQRSTNLSRVRNMPPGYSGGFYCIIENTITASRRKITFYPMSAGSEGTYYECVETSSGYGSWYVFQGTVLTQSREAGNGEESEER